CSFVGYSIWSTNSNSVWSVEYSPFVTNYSVGNSNVICSGSTDNTIRFWDVRSNNNELYMIKEDEGVLCFKFIGLKRKNKMKNVTYDLNLVRNNESRIIEEHILISYFFTESSRHNNSTFHAFQFSLLKYVQFFCFINQIKNICVKYFCFLKKGHVTSLFSKKIKLKNFLNINNMGNRTTTQNSPEREPQTKQSQQIITPFQTLKKLPATFWQSQCVQHEHELLICGGICQRDCYSYHTLKNEYKFVCKYPSDVTLIGHCVVKLIDNNNKDSNQITLLSFGSDYKGKNKHTLMMKYVSVWSNISKRSNKFKNCNEWIPFKGNHNHPIIIGRDSDDYLGVRALIGGIDNNLLFITYKYNNISVFDLNIFQFIKHDTLPTAKWIWYHCFVSKSENGQGRKMMKTNKQNYQMLLFCFNAGLSIEYDEDNNNFQFHKLPVCDDIAPFCAYAYVCINDIILFFGGWNCEFDGENAISKSVHKYSIRENKWMTFENTLPNPLKDCLGILNKEDNHIHIIGGKDDKNASVSTHMKTKVCEWYSLQLIHEINLLNMILVLALFQIMKFDNFFLIIFKILKRLTNNKLSVLLYLLSFFIYLLVFVFGYFFKNGDIS
ncbi:hypothetical protein RFI_00938, partial [Reticulomyxa filosa]